MVTADRDPFGQAFENALACVANDGRFTVHGVIENPQFASKSLHDSLQAQADAEDWNVEFYRPFYQLIDPEIGGAARAGRDQKQIGLQVFEEIQVEAGAIGRHLRACLPGVIRQRVDEAIVVIDQ